MNLTRTIIHRPIATAMVFGIIGIMGAVALTKLPINELPNVTFPAVTISVADPGANSTTVDQQVTKPLEQALQGVSGVTKMVSTSSEGNASINLTFVGGTDVNAADNAVAQVVSRAQKQLPAGISPPAISEVNPLATPLMTVNFSGNIPPAQLYDAVTTLVEPPLNQVAGVGQITLAGGLEPEANVVVDPAVLTARGLSLKDVTSAIAAENVNTANGSTSSGQNSNSISTSNQAQSPAQLGNLVVGSPGGLPVTLGEVASVQQGFAPVTTTNELNGVPTVALTILPQTSANAVATNSALTSTLAQIQQHLPPGMHYTITADSTTFTLAALSATGEDLVLAIILASLVILLFLQSARQTLIVATIIPSVLLATALMMFFFGFSLDLISLLALSLLIGILVDSAIVMVENITRHLHMGKEPAEAAYDGRMEIGAALVALTLTDVIVFLPVAFVTGNTGAIFREFGITVVVASLFSLVVAFTLTPMLAAHWLKPGRREPRQRVTRAMKNTLERGMAGMQDGYERVLRRSLRHRPLVLLVALGAVAMTIFYLPSGLLGTAYVPQADTGIVVGNAQMPPGTTLATTNAALEHLSSEVMRLPGVTDVVVQAGQGGGGAGGGGVTTNTGTISVDLAPASQRPESIYTVETDVAKMAHSIPGLKVGTSIPAPLVTPGSSAVAVVLRGPDLATLDQISTKVVSAMQGIPGLAQVQSTASQATPAWNIVVNQSAAQSFGLTAQEVAAEISTAVNGTTVTTLQTSSGVAEPIQVTIPGNTSLGLTQLENLPIAVADPAASAPSASSSGSSATSTVALPGSSVPAPVDLGQMATIVHGAAPLAINEYDELPQVTVHAGLPPGVALGTVTAEVQAAVRKVGLPPGYDFLMGGQASQQSSAFAPLLVALYLAPFLIYMLLAALYESLLLPFAVLLAVPLALFGGLGALVVFHQTLNLFSLLGAVMLVGLVSKNAILLVDYTETLRKRGVERHQAVIEGARTRMRPVLMTTVTLVIAMLPIAFLAAPGSEYRSPVALVLIGGMSTSTLLTLVVVPTLYIYLDNMRQRWFRFRGKPDGYPGIATGERADELPTVSVPG